MGAVKLEPIRRSSASDAVFEQLLGKLLAGDLQDGAALPPERTLTDLLGVSRQAVREALQRLAQAGLVTIQHGGSTRARDYRREASLDLLPRLLIHSDGSVDPRVARSIMEMRAAVGADAARLCARRAASATVDDLEATSREMREAEDLESLAELDLRFWDLVVDGADNVAYRLAFNSLRRTYEPLVPVLAGVLEEELRDTGTRERLVSSIRAGRETDAATAASDLLARGTSGISARFAT